MGNPLHDLEKRLERMVPQGLSEEGRSRLENQIDQLAGQVALAPARRKRGWRMVAGLAATIAVVAGGVVLMKGAGGDASPEVAMPEPASHEPVDSGFKMLSYEREIDDGRDLGIVLSRFNEPMRSWNYRVKEMELILDKESGLKVRIVSERNTAVLTAVTSF